MKSITIKNFKSYQNQTINDLNPKINVILGANGQGKSNLLKAISFLFTDKFTINKNQQIKILYRGAKQNDNQIEVQANFTQRLSAEPFKITKNWKNGSIQDLRVNQKPKTRNQFENFIESFGLSYSNPYNIVQQGKITQITFMDQFQLYKLLEEATGIRKFKKRIQIVSNDLIRVSSLQNQIKQVLNDTKQKLVAVQDKKNQFQYFALQQKTRGIKSKRALINSLQNLKKNLQQNKNEFTKCSKQIDQSHLKIKQRNYQISQLQSLYKVTEEKIKFYQSQQSADHDLQRTSISNFVLNQKDMNKKQIKKLLSEKQNQLKKLTKIIQNDELSILKQKNQANQLQKTLQTYRQKYQTIKADFQIQNGQKNKTKIKANLQNQIQIDRQNIKNIHLQVQKLQKFIKQLEKPYTPEKDQLQLQKITQQCDKICQFVRLNKIKLIENGRKKMNFQCQAQTISNRKKYYEDIMRKILPNVDFNLLNILRKQNIRGVHGYLIQFLKINSDVRFAYQLAGLNKLCTLLVENQDVASTVIQINKKIKGKQINVLPLTFISNQLKQKRSYPSSDKAHSLLNKDWISVNDELNLSKQFSESVNKIINNTFSKYMLVEDYSTGLKISKQYHLNCITSESQIVYADAFMCKVGKQQSYQKSRIQIFLNYQTFVNQQQKNTQQIYNSQKVMNQLQNEQIQLFGKYNECQAKKRQIKQRINEEKQVQRTLDKIKNQKLKLIGVINRLQKNIQQKLASIQRLKTNSKIKFSIQDLKQSETDYFTVKNKIDLLLQQVYRKEKSVSKIRQNIEQLKAEILQISKKHPNEKQNNSSHLNATLLLNKQAIISDLKKQFKFIQERLTTMSKQVRIIQNDLVKLKENQSYFNAQIIISQQQQNLILNKIQQLGEIQQNEEQLEELSHSMSINLGINNSTKFKKHHFTAKDKLFFSKISTLLQKYKIYSLSWQKNLKAEQNLNKLMQKYDHQSQRYMSELIKKFQVQFKQLFGKIVPNGKSDVRQKKITQNIKGIVKFKNCLDIKVSFSQDQEFGRWKQFSGGQKTVLAICVIMTLQKCQPAPFYIFDEIDSALSQHYSEKVAQIIKEQSQKSQYFITSFKKKMLNFGQQQANFYLVQSQNRVSKVVRVDINQAKRISSQIAH